MQARGGVIKGGKEEGGNGTEDAIMEEQAAGKD